MGMALPSCSADSQVYSEREITLGPAWMDPHGQAASLRPRIVPKILPPCYAPDKTIRQGADTLPLELKISALLCQQASTTYSCGSMHIPVSSPHSSSSERSPDLERKQTFISKDRDTSLILRSLVNWPTEKHEDQWPKSYICTENMEILALNWSLSEDWNHLLPLRLKLQGVLALLCSISRHTGAQPATELEKALSNLLTHPSHPLIPSYTPWNPYKIYLEHKEELFFAESSNSIVTAAKDTTSDFHIKLKSQYRLCFVVVFFLLVRT